MTGTPKSRIDRPIRKPRLSIDVSGLLLDGALDPVGLLSPVVLRDPAFVQHWLVWPVWTLCMLGSLGCGRISFDELPTSTSELVCGDWSAAERLPNVNSEANELAVALGDGYELYFQSDRPGTGAQDLYRASRARLDEPFGAPIELQATSSPFNDIEPIVGATTGILYFLSERDAGYQLYAYSLAGVSVVPELGNLGGPGLSHDELELIYLEGSVVSRAMRPSLEAPWLKMGAIPELDGEGREGWATFSADHLEIYFESERTGIAQIFHASRATRDAPFSTPVLIPIINLPGINSGDPELSRDGRTLLFSANVTTAAVSDLYMVTRECE